MPNVIVNATLDTRERPTDPASLPLDRVERLFSVMSPEITPSSGGRVGRAASGPANNRDAARAGDLPVLARGFGVLAVAIGTLVLNAEGLWPHLFAP